MLTNLFDYLAGYDFEALTRFNPSVVKSKNLAFRKLYEKFKSIEKNPDVKRADIPKIDTVNTMTLEEFKQFVLEKIALNKDYFQLKHNLGHKVYQICFDQNKISSDDLVFLFESGLNLSPANILVNSGNILDLYETGGEPVSERKLLHSDLESQELTDKLNNFKTIKRLSSAIRLFSLELKTNETSSFLTNSIVILSSTDKKSAYIKDSLIDKVIEAYGKHLFKKQNEDTGKVVIFSFGLLVSALVLVPKVFNFFHAQ